MPILYASIQVHRCVLERAGEGWPEETIWWSIPAATVFSNGNDPVWWCLMGFVQTWIPRNFKSLKPQNKIGGVNAAFLH